MDACAEVTFLRQSLGRPLTKSKQGTRALDMSPQVGTRAAEM